MSAVESGFPFILLHTHSFPPSWGGEEMVPRLWVPRLVKSTVFFLWAHSWANNDVDQCVFSPHLQNVLKLLYQGMSCSSSLFASFESLSAKKNCSYGNGWAMGCQWIRYHLDPSWRKMACAFTKRAFMRKTKRLWSTNECFLFQLESPVKSRRAFIP